MSSAEQPGEQCLILKPFAGPSWSEIIVGAFIGFYAMPNINEEYRAEYLRRIDEAAHTLLEFARKDVADNALLSWETEERTIEDMIEMGAADDIDSKWAIIVGVNVELETNDLNDDVAQSFSFAWIPRFSSVMQFHVPFNDAPILPILDGDRNCALLLHR